MTYYDGYGVFDGPSLSGLKAPPPCVIVFKSP